MKRKTYSTVAVCLSLLLSTALGGCGNPTYDGFTAPQQGESTLTPVKSYYTDISYEGIEPTVEETIKTYSSKDGLCVIEQKKSYYDVTLDFESGSHRAVGAAYAETVLQACPEYPEGAEEYLFENIKDCFPGTEIDYSALQKRLDVLKNSLDDDYQQEMEGFAEVISGGNKDGFKEDGKLSYQEAMLVDMVPDALRGTACSAFSANGNVTESGKRISARLLEWFLGTDNKLCTMHCVTHFKNGSKSFTSVGAIGELNLLTGVNPSGMFIGELDVGTVYGAEFVYEGKTCYSYGLRYAAENYTTARQAAQYLLENSKNYTFSSNAFITDNDEALCVEMCVNDLDGRPVIRDSETPLHKGLEWDNNNYFCIVNSFTAGGNADQLTNSSSNIDRWAKYNKMFCQEENVSLTRFKEIICSEQTEDTNSYMVNIRSNTLVHMVIADYDTRTLQAILTGEDGTNDNPEFIYLGTF